MGCPQRHGGAERVDRKGAYRPAPPQCAHTLHAEGYVFVGLRVQAIDELGDTTYEGASNRVREAEQMYTAMEDGDPDGDDEADLVSEVGSEGSELSDGYEDGADGDD